MQAVRLNQAGEHVSQKFRQVIAENGMAFQFSLSHCSKPNRYSEHFSQKLWKMAQTMLFESGMDV